MANGEIAYLEQFLLLPQYFQKLSAAEASDASIYGKGLKFSFRRVENIVALRSIMSNFFLCHVVFKRPLLQRLLNALCSTRTINFSYFALDKLTRPRAEGVSPF